MKPGPYDIQLKRGAAYTPSAFIYSNGATPVNLTGSTVKAQIRDKCEGTMLAEFVVTVIPLTGSIQLYLSKETVASLIALGTVFREKTVLVWDLFITPLSGDAYCLLEGSVYLTPRSTQL